MSTNPYRSINSLNYPVAVLHLCNKDVENQNQQHLLLSFSCGTDLRLFTDSSINMEQRDVSLHRGQLVNKRFRGSQSDTGMV